MDTEKDIVIPAPEPGAAPMPGLALGDILRFAPAIEQFVLGLVSGHASFVVSVHGVKRRINIEAE